MAEDLKRCSRCGNISLNCNFFKNISIKDGLNPICKVCRIKYYNGKHEQKTEYQKLYAKQNKENIKEYKKYR